MNILFIWLKDEIKRGDLKLGIVYNSGQKELISRLKKWYKDLPSPYFSFSGPAGSGKTFVIKGLINELKLHKNEVACAAYVGKAVLVLQRHNLMASTIHSLIYTPVVERYEKPNGKIGYNFKFILKDKLDERIKLIVIDEATMVNDDMADDILSFGIPTIFVGDKNQLPPIFGESRIMNNPDYTLTQLMRQAEDDPIVMLAHQALHGIPIFQGNYGTSRVIDKHPVDYSLLKNYDIILCATNATRDKMNFAIRDEILGYPSIIPRLGEKIICRKNNWDRSIGKGIYLTNGLIGFIDDIYEEGFTNSCMYIDFRPDFMNEAFENISLDLEFLQMSYEQKRHIGMGGRNNRFEFGYCITTHLSQGSEFDDVLFIDEGFCDEELSRKLRYTAITRAKRSITIVTIPLV